MSTRESKVFARLKERVTRPTDRFERIENGLVDGMPDCNYCILGTEGWIEIKSPDEPVRESTPLFGSNHPVSVEQINWFRRQHYARGLAFLFIATPRRLVLLNCPTVVSVGAKINTLPVVELERISVWRESVPTKHHEAWMNLRELLATPPA